MSGSVDVDEAAVKGGIRCCEMTIAEFNKIAGDLDRKCKAVGQVWKDEKYRDLEAVVENCCNALNKPISQLEDCQKKLNDLLKAIIAYKNASVR